MNIAHLDFLSNKSFRKINLAGKNNLRTLKLFINNKCNMDCAYCYVRKNPLSALSLEESIKGVEHFLNGEGDEKNIQFLGGEPLLEFAKIKDIVKHIEKKYKNKKVKFILNTNGLALDQEKVDFFNRRDGLIILSIDGSKKSHDRHRKIKNSNESSYLIIMDNLKKMDLSNTKLMANYVFTSETIDDVLGNLKNMVKMGFKMIDFRPDINQVVKEEYYKKLKKFFDGFISYYIAAFRKNKKEIFFVPTIHNLLDSRFAFSSLWCDTISLAPDGKYYSCCRLLGLDKNQRREYSLGTIKSGIDIQRRTVFLKRTRKETDKYFSQCKQCEFLPYCYCKIDTYLYLNARKENFSEGLKSLCRYTKIFKGAMLKIINVLFKENNQEFKKLYNVK